MSNQTKPDYTSLVPHYTFADTLEEQEAQLKENPLLQRMLAYRHRYDNDPHRPIYHYVNPENTLNDPNGLCFWQGRWHLFYQAYPPEDPRQHWGHAVSDDLIHWRDLPYAIYPNPERCCFSGATLVEEDRVIAMYHGTEVGNMVALSSDPLLLNWDKVTGQAVIPIANDDGSPLPYRVFDPCIWTKNGVYYALSAGTLPHETSRRRTRADFLFRSTDLAHWEYLHPFVEGDRMTKLGDDGACPYFWPIGDRHMLLFFSHMSGGQALLGDYDTERDKFVVTSHHEFNFGPAWPAGTHAPSATPDGTGGVISIWNMNAARACDGWDQIMTLPRRLTLLGDGHLERDMLHVEPAGDVESLRIADSHQQVCDLALPANEEIVFDGTVGDGIVGNAIEIVAEIDTGDSPMIELDVLRSSNREEVTRICFYRGRGFRDWERYNGWDKTTLAAATYSAISIDTSNSSTLPGVQFRAPETAQVYIAPDEHLKLRVFVDKSVVEVYVNEKQCLALRVYPGREDSVGVSLKSQGEEARLVSLDIWDMANIYK